MLVEACLAGDRSAFAELVDTYQSKLYNAAFRITGSSADAMDATQGAFVKAYENLQTFDRSRRFFSWIYRIALNEAFNIIDRRRGHSELVEEIPGGGNDPEQACQAAETNEWIQKALMNMPEEQRAVLVLRHFHGLSYREIGEVVGVSEKMVKSRLFMARQNLRAFLSEQGLVQ